MVCTVRRRSSVDDDEVEGKLPLGVRVISLDDGVPIGDPYSDTDLPSTFLSIDAFPGMRRLPEMWCCVKESDCGVFIEMEFTEAPMGIVFQVRGCSLFHAALVWT